MLNVQHMPNIAPGKPNPGLFVLVMAWACVTLFAGQFLSAEDAKPPVEEFEAKAVLVYHFAKFTSWPEGTFETDSSPISISVYGDKGFYDALKKYQGRVINGRALDIHHIKIIAQESPPQILYATGTMDATVSYYLKNQSSPTLTIGETVDFVKQGGILSIVRDKEHLTLFSNLKAAVETKLYLNNNLVKLTKQVSSGPDGKMK